MDCYRTIDPLVVISPRRTLRGWLRRANRRFVVAVGRFVHGRMQRERCVGCGVPERGRARRHPRPWPDDFYHCGCDLSVGQPRRHVVFDPNSGSIVSWKRQVAR